MAHSDANLEVLPSPNFEGDDRYVYGYTLRRPDAFDQEETARQMLKMLGLPILKTKQLGLHDFHSTVFYIAAWSPVHQEVLSVWTADNRIPGPEDRETIQEQLGDEWEGPRWIKADEPFSCAKVKVNNIQTAFGKPIRNHATNTLEMMNSQAKGKGKVATVAREPSPPWVIEDAEPAPAPSQSARHESSVWDIELISTTDYNKTMAP
ncbi:DNA excision repair protein ERCC-1 [Mycena kentingensis (nom. inval.)]|nr:DNA excision repair protein ERCC-1 [Mycena kentingensis (nom. inval.)]